MSLVSIKLVKIGSASGLATDEIVRISFSTPVTLSVIKQSVEQHWPALKPGSLTLSYTDLDKDVVLLSTNEGIAEALMYHSGPVLKILIEGTFQTRPGTPLQCLSGCDCAAVKHHNCITQQTDPP